MNAILKLICHTSSFSVVVVVVSRLGFAIMEARAILKEHGRQNAKQKRKRQVQRRQANVNVAEDASQTDSDEPTANKNEASTVIVRLGASG